MIAKVQLILHYLGPIGLAKAIYYATITAIARTIGIKTMKKNVFNYKLYLDTTDKGISRTLFLFGQREIDHYKILQEILKPGLNILDIGANIGYYAIMESLVVGSTGKITAIEPMLPNISMLKRNIALNNASNIEVIHGAVSKSTGTAKMFLSSHSNLHTFHRDGSAFKYLNATPIDVPTMTLHDAGKRSGSRPGLIRMDVEGHEVEILRQLANLARKEIMTPLVIFETHLSRYNKDNDFVPVLENLFDLGYLVRTAASANNIGTSQLRALGYKSDKPFYSDFGERAIFHDIDNHHAIDLICNVGGLRTVLLEKTR